MQILNYLKAVFTTPAPSRLYYNYAWSFLNLETEDIDSEDIPFQEPTNIATAK